MSAAEARLVEPAAEAVWRAHTLAPPGVSWGELAEVSRQSYRRMAVAAIEAMQLRRGYDPARDCLVIEVPVGVVGSPTQPQEGSPDE